MPVSPLNIAVVEDDESLRSALGRALATSGLESSQFASAEDFLRVPAGTFDCAVLDIHLGGMSGLELHQRLKQSGVGLPVIFITSYDEPDLCARALEMGCADFLRKPFATRVLLDAITVATAARSPNDPNFI